FDVELAGSGEPGLAPGWGVLMQACAMSETVNEDESVVYAPVSEGEKSITLYFNMDGILHRLLGARGTVKLAFTSGAIPKLSFSFVGLYSPPADVALPAVTLSAFKK